MYLLNVAIQQESHFRTQHFICTAPVCLEQKFVVFETKLDLQAHQVEAHAAELGIDKRQRAEARRIETNFTYGGVTEQTASGSDRGAGRGAEGSRRRGGGAAGRNRDRAAAEFSSGTQQREQRDIPGLHPPPSQRQTRATFSGSGLTPENEVAPSASTSRPRTPQTPNGFRTSSPTDPETSACASHSLLCFCSCFFYLLTG
jgi:hypothetical protein